MKRDLDSAASYFKGGEHYDTVSMLEIPLRLLCRGWTRPEGLRMRTGKLGSGSGSRKREGSSLDTGGEVKVNGEEES